MEVLTLVKLSIIGFGKYSLIYETYALTSNYDNERFQNVEEMRIYFYQHYKDYKKRK